MILRLLLCLISFSVWADEEPSKPNLLTDEIPSNINLLAWEGYVSQVDVENINTLLKNQGYNYQVELYPQNAENAEQVYYLFRLREVDIGFITLSFFNGHGLNFFKLLQPINIDSPRLTHYPNLVKRFVEAPDGILNEQRYYVPFGLGFYGFYLNRTHYPDLISPTSVSDLFTESYRGLFSLCISQPIYNLAVVLKSLKYPPSILEDMIKNGERSEFIKLMNKDSVISNKLQSLYRQAGDFWYESPNLRQQKIAIVSSWGPEIGKSRKAGIQWEKINFSEGDMAWLDTLAISGSIKGRKLEASEIVINYFISSDYQNKLLNDLNIYPVIYDEEHNLDTVMLPSSSLLINNMVDSLSTHALAELNEHKIN